MSPLTLPVVDLRSDTVTRPTPGMRAAIAAAEVGDDVYGEDPTVAALEEQVAGLLGHEAGLFVPTGSMDNQLGLRLLVAPGQELVAHEQAHVVRYELGAAAALSGITTRTYASPGGAVDVDAIAAMWSPVAGVYEVRTTAVAVENTHNAGGGTVVGLDVLRELRERASSAGVALHLDGARLWNAQVATGTDLAEYGRLFDTVSVCLSKGLGAPVGSVLASTGERVAAARVWRKRLGGGWRQAGLLAAAGQYALAHHRDRLAEDHDRARRLAMAIGARVPQTNIVLVDVADAAAVVAAAASAGILVSTMGPGTVRAVTHLDVDDEGIQRATDVLGRLLGGAAPTPSPGGPATPLR